jgi:hypothetical protein
MYSPYFAEAHASARRTEMFAAAERARRARQARASRRSATHQRPDLRKWITARLIRAPLG